jgi:hypothetical protein
MPLAKKCFCLFALAASAIVLTGCTQENSNKNLSHFHDYNKLSDTCILIRHESTGKLVEIVTRDTVTNQIIAREIGYRDGRRGYFQYRLNGTLEHFTNYSSADKKLITYAAEYDSKGLRIVSSKSYSNAGTLESTFVRHNDGNKETCFYRADQTLSFKKTVCPNGSSQTISYADDGKSVLTQSNIASEPKQINVNAYGQIFIIPRLKVTAIGDNLNSWKYFSGKNSHSAEFTPEGNLVFTFHVNQAKFRQVWRLVGEDWYRTYYVLDYAEDFHAKTDVVYRRFTMHPRKRTPARIDVFRNNGLPMYCHHYGLSGEHLLTQAFKDNGELKGQFQNFGPLGKPKPVDIAEFMVNAPQDKSTGLGYRLTGELFAEPPTKSLGDLPSPLFTTTYSDTQLSANP